MLHTSHDPAQTSWQIRLLGKITFTALAAVGLIASIAIWLFGESILPREQAYVLCDRFAPYFTAWENWHKWRGFHSEIVVLYFGSFAYGLCSLLILLFGFETHKPLYWGRSVPRWVLYGFLDVQFKDRRKQINKLMLTVVIGVAFFTFNLDITYLFEGVLLDTTGAPRSRRQLILHASHSDFLVGGIAFYMMTLMGVFFATVFVSVTADFLILYTYRIRISWLRHLKQFEKAEQLEARLIARDEEMLQAQIRFQQQHEITAKKKKAQA